MIRPRAWRHRDGGLVLGLAGDRWLLELVIARRRRDRWGRGRPLEVTLTTYWPTS